MSISIVIPVYKPDKKLFSSLKRLLKQSIPADGIYLYLTVSDEYGIKELKQEIKKNGLDEEYFIYREVQPEDFSHGGTRQLAASECSSDYILFLTQDAVPCDRHLLEKLLNGFKNGNQDSPEAAVCYGRQLPYKNALTMEKFSRQFNYPEFSIFRTKADLEDGNVKAIFCSDVCAMYDRKIFVQLGGFETSVNFNEDELYAFKALSNGYSVGYRAEAKVYHSHNLTLREQFWRNFEIARSQKQFPEVFGNLKSEGEGLRYVKDGLSYIAQNGNVFEAAYFMFYCGVRYLGFLAGKLF